MTESHDAERDHARIESRAELLPEERVAGSDDPEAEAEAILEESEERTDHPEETRLESTQTPDPRPRHTELMTLPWPIPARTDLRERLVAAYANHRGYHDLRHLIEVLQRIGELGEGDNTEVVLAAWFHDAVYDDSGNNEERSAQLALSELAGTDGVDADEVARLVRLTTDHRPGPADHNGAVLCDADLAILAAPPERYKEYVAGVRLEYAAVPEAEFRLGRLAVLEHLATKDTLFHTPHARQEWEARARDNLVSEIDLLRADL